MTPVMTSTLILPVGLLLGTFHGDAGTHHEVRVGQRVHELTDPDLAGWAFAHGPPGASAEPWTGAALMRHMSGAGLPAAASIVDSLLARHLLVEVEPGTDPAVAFARAHRVVPTVPGLGNSAEQPHLYSIGLPGRELIRVDRPVFEVWAWGHLDANLWRACETFAAQERAAGGTDPELTEPAGVLSGFLGVLHGLLGVQTAYVDTAGSVPAAPAVSVPAAPAVSVPAASAVSVPAAST